MVNEWEPLLPESTDVCEIFLAYEDIKKIKLIEGFKFNKIKIRNADDLLSYMVIEKNNYPLTLDKYIEDEILLSDITLFQ